MVAAYKNTTWELVYHGSSNHYDWTMFLPSLPNTAASTNGGAMQTITSGPNVSLPNGSQLFVTFNENTQLVEYNVLVMDQSWIAVGYGTTMFGTDMVYWSANG